MSKIIFLPRKKWNVALGLLCLISLLISISSFLFSSFNATVHQSIIATYPTLQLSGEMIFRFFYLRFQLCRPLVKVAPSTSPNTLHVLLELVANSSPPYEELKSPSYITKLEEYPQDCCGDSKVPTG